MSVDTPLIPPTATADAPGSASPADKSGVSRRELLRRLQDEDQARARHAAARGGMGWWEFLLGGGAAATGAAQASPGYGSGQLSLMQKLRQMWEQERQKRAAEKASTNDQSMGRVTARAASEADHLEHMKDLERLSKDGNFLERITSRVRLVTEPVTWAIRHHVANITHAIASPFIKAGKAIVAPVAGLFGSGAKDAALAKDGIELAKDGAEGARLAKDGVEIAHVAEDGDRLLRLAKGLKLVSRCVTAVGLGGAGFTLGISAGVSTAIDVGLGVIAGGLTYMATGNAKASALEGLDTASPVPVKGALALMHGNVRQAAADTVNWTGLGVFTPVNNFVHRIAQGESLWQRRSEIVAAAKGVAKGAEEIVTHPAQDIKAVGEGLKGLGWAAHHMRAALGVVVGSLGLVGAGVLTAAKIRAVRRGEQQGVIGHATAKRVVERGARDLEREAKKKAEEFLSSNTARTEIGRVAGAGGDLASVAARAGHGNLPRAGLKSMVPPVPEPKPGTAAKVIKDAESFVPSL